MPIPLHTRFAPTPSGYVHAGNAWSFLLTWLVARSQRGNIHLRIDDLDSVRHQDRFVEDIFASLTWLGLDWDTGPHTPLELVSRYSQHLKIKEYLAALEQVKMQQHLYACICSRESVRRTSAAKGQPGIYPGTCFSHPISIQTPGTALRFHVVNNSVLAKNEFGKSLRFNPIQEMGDFLVRQKNGEPSYHLVSVIEDEAMGVNFIVRGADLAASTGAQLALASALGGTHFLAAQFWHHDLVLNSRGEKLSKSEGSESLLSMRNRLPNAIPLIRYFAKRMGIFEPINSLQDLLPFFKLEKVPKIPISFAELRESL